MIRLARVESELDYWFSGEPPNCSILWLIAAPEGLVSALTELAASVEPQSVCGAAVCSPVTRPPSLGPAFGGEQLLQAKVEFEGGAIDNASSLIIRHPSSRGSVGQVVSSVPSRSEGVWRLLATATGLRVCAGMFPAAVSVPDDWTYSALRLVMNAGTSLLNRGAASGAKDAPPACVPGRHAASQRHRCHQRRTRAVRARNCPNRQCRRYRQGGGAVRSPSSGRRPPTLSLR